MSQFYTTYAALVAHLEKTQGETPCPHIAFLLHQARWGLQQLQLTCNTITEQADLLDDVEDLFRRPADVAAVFNLGNPGTAIAMHGIEAVVALAADAAMLLRSETLATN